METVFENLKSFILETVNPALEDYEDEEITLPKFEEKSIKFGVIDPVKNTAPLLCAIYPETVEESKDYISDDGQAFEYSVTICVLLRGDTYDRLMKKICRYADAIKESVYKNHSISGTCENAKPGISRIYPDCGITEKQAVAVEMELTIIKE